MQTSPTTPGMKTLALMEYVELEVERHQPELFYSLDNIRDGFVLY